MCSRFRICFERSHGLDAPWKKIRRDGTILAATTDQATTVCLHTMVERIAEKICKTIIFRDLGGVIELRTGIR